ncbi:MAG: baseplate J/gp47 family protein [Desulfovibrionaceae bacterium]|nr:baseplate J/gp47 family protein [Desulfovibrionaceae bacterium]
MSETFPRFSLPPVDFLTIGADEVEANIITGYEKASGRTLAAGDPVRLFLLTIAAAITQLRSAVNTAARMNLLSYARGDYLDSLGILFGVLRLPASAAVTTLRFTLSQALGQDYAIPSGTKAGNGNVTFSTDRAMTIPAGSLSGEISATCETPGTDGNDYVPGQINALVNPQAYIASVENTSVTSGGADAESDEDLAARIRLAPNAFSVAGPEKAYVYHAYSANSAISDVAVMGDENNPGDVHVYIMLDDGLLPTEAVCQGVKEYLSAETRRPLTDHVFVSAPAAVPFEIKVDWYLNAGDVSREVAISDAVSLAVAEYRAWQTEAIGRESTPASSSRWSWLLAPDATEFDAESWGRLLDHAVVTRDGSIMFVFKNGQEIKA